MEFSNFTVAINGIHTTIQYPQSAGSVSYKPHYSMVLQAVTDTIFIYVDVGD
jgi:hypothetical protein